jgi:heat shock protein 1/8
LQKSLKTSLASDELKGKIPQDEFKRLEEKIAETLSWLDTNLNADKDEYDEKRKDLEGVANPILQNAANAAKGAGGMPGSYADYPSATSPASSPAGNQDAGDGPAIEELD